jgi:hypothetical protein
MAIYVGFLYNEFYAVPTLLGHSSWTVGNTTSSYMVPVPGKATYPFGVDPAWKVSLRAHITATRSFCPLRLGCWV